MQEIEDVGIHCHVLSFWTKFRVLMVHYVILSFSHPQKTSMRHKTFMPCTSAWWAARHMPQQALKVEGMKTKSHASRKCACILKLSSP